MSTEESKQCNVLELNAGASLFSLPAKLTVKDDEPASTHPFTYTMEVQVPVAADRSVTVTLPGGELTKPQPDTTAEGTRPTMGQPEARTHHEDGTHVV